MELGLKEKRTIVRCAVIGIGSMGKKYAEMIDSGKIDGLTLAAVCCRSAENAEWAALNLGRSVRICRTEDMLYEDLQSFDAVLVVTPHKLHPAMAIRALQAGKHVMCDKPAGITTADAEAINKAAERSGKVFAMMCHQRTYAQYRKIKQLLEEQSIGQITRVSLENSNYFRTQYYHRSGSWRSSWNGEGGGALINQGYHLLDMWQYLFGLPESVYANIPFGKYNDFDVDDEATLVMDYPQKMTGIFVLSTGEGSQTERLEIIGTAGKMLLDGQKLQVTHFNCDVREYSKRAQVTSRQELRETMEEYQFGDPDQAYETMLKNFADAIRDGEHLIAPGIESSDTLALVNAAYLSAWQGKRIFLPVDMEQYNAILHDKAEKEKRAEENGKKKS